VRILVEAANAAVGVSHGVIVPPTGRFDTVVRVPRGEVRPGLINAHDHLHRNHYGRLGEPPYANAYDWGRDIHARHGDEIARGGAMPRVAALLRGAWKNLLAGVTTVVHHDRWEPAFDDDFPLRVARVRSAHSLGFEPELAGIVEAGAEPFAIHLAEGVDAEAADEVRALAGRGLLTRQLLAVHLVGADTDGIRRLRESGAAMVWCPTSNDFLFGQPAPAGLLAPGMDVLIGSDSLLTGTGSLLDELRFARSLGLLSDERLENAVGAVAALRLLLPSPSLREGARADLVVLTRPLLDSSDADVAVVIAGGELRVLDPGLSSQLGPHAPRGQLRSAGGVTRWVSGLGARLAGAHAGTERRPTRPEEVLR
jgi:hypothetical protein